MKPTTPHDPLDDLIAAALHGDLTPEERAQFESRLSTDPNAQAAYQEAKAMHELLEQTNRSAQPDPDFEQRMVSGVRRKIAQPPHQETAWESLLFFWNGVRWMLTSRWKYGIGGVGSAMFLALVLAYYHDIHVLALGRNGIASPGPIEEYKTYLPPELFVSKTRLDDWKTRQVTRADLKKAIQDQGINYVDTAQKGMTLSGYVDSSSSEEFGGRAIAFPAASGPALASAADSNLHKFSQGLDAQTTQQEEAFTGVPFTARSQIQREKARELKSADATYAVSTTPPPVAAPYAMKDELVARDSDVPILKSDDLSVTRRQLAETHAQLQVKELEADQGQTTDKSGKIFGIPSLVGPQGAFASVATAAPADTRKLIRNAQLDLQVKSYQSTLDQVSALTKAAGGYVDTSSSQRGGNGKLQGTVVVKILPENLDAFLLKLRDLGEVQNQSVSTDDVTKEYFDTQARLVNSQKMELQLQELLKRENGKVSDLLAVERELGRVRGDIEQMQGQLKLYDFQVQYATVTMNIAEKDLNQAAAYLLKEQDDFSLYATDVEGAFQKARAAADQFNAQVLAANLEHVVNSDNNQVTASLVVMVAPDQIEPFLTQVRGLGRVANFTRQTQRVAKDGGDSSQPADETKTEKDKVRVQLSIRSDDDSRKQVALTVVTKDVNAALDQAKAAALANAGTEILGSSLNTSPQGASTAQLNVRVPGKEYTTLMDAFRALGRRASLSVQRNDNAGPGASGDDVPVIVTLALTDNDAPVQETSLVLSANDVDTQAQQIKKQAGDAGVEIKSSSFERQPDGSELAQMTLRLPLGDYAAFLATLQQAGKTESLSVQRDDRPDQTRPDDSAPAEIQLQVHNPPAIVPDNSGLWATLRDTFSQGFGALFGSVKVIGVIVAFLTPWVVAIVVFAWLGRRIYVWRKHR